MNFRTTKVIGMLLLSSSLLIGLYSCDDPVSPTDPVDQGMTGYPTANGSEWIYSMNGADAIKYTISGTFNHPSGGECKQFFVFTEGGKGEEDWVEYATYYLKYANNEVRVYTDDADPDYWLLLKFPLKTGETWNFDANTTATVGDKTDITVGAGGFSVYQIDYNGDYDFSMWYSDKVGGWGVKNYGWWYYQGDPVTTELSSYNIPSK